MDGIEYRRVVEWIFFNSILQPNHRVIEGYVLYGQNEKLYVKNRATKIHFIAGKSLILVIFVIY